MSQAPVESMVLVFMHGAETLYALHLFAAQSTSVYALTFVFRKESQAPTLLLSSCHARRIRGGTWVWRSCPNLFPFRIICRSFIFVID